MKVLLLKDVYKLGRAGDVKKVADGYGRNFLLPQKLAVLATAGALKQVEKIRSQAEIRRAEQNSELKGLADQINGVTLVFAAKAGETGKLYGSITTQDVATALQEKIRFEVKKQQIDIQPIRNLGANLEVVQSIASFYQASDVVDQREFKNFTTASLRGDNGIVLVGWAPSVRPGGWQQHLAEAPRLTTAPNYAQAVEANQRAAGDPAPASKDGKQFDHFPLLFVEPFAERRCRGRTRALELLREPFEHPLRSRLVGRPVRRGDGAPRVRLHAIGQGVEHVAPLVHLAALHERPLAEHRAPPCRAPCCRR